MRVCHLVRQYHPSVGGLETFVATLAGSLHEHGCRSDVITLDRQFRTGARLPMLEKIEGIRVHRVPMVGHPRFFLPLVPADLLARYDVVHVHGIDGFFDRIARHKRAPGQVLIATSHGLFFHTPWMSTVKHAYLQTITRVAASRYDAMIANSASDLRRLRGVAPRVVQLPNGVAPLGSYVASGRDLLYLGRLARHKHVERIIAAIAQPQLEDVTLHVVGPEWGVSLLDLARTAERLGVGDRVRLHGQLDGPALHAVVRSCGLFVSASTYEGFGMSLIEAMSVGLLPVVHSNPAFVELVAEAGCGALTDFVRPQPPALAMRRVLDQLDDRARQRAIRFAGRFTWRAHADATMRIYENARGAAESLAA